ncbi:MAG: GntR family transcriptional regulator [Chloroflexi bacterium]|nr:GntR family transcriptional regulator [Chloroflexota bacterium]
MANTPDRKLPAPLYAQIKQILLERIHSGEWQTGDSIPTETDLCRSFNVSRITVRSALKELVTEGYLERISGRGTFVTQPRIDQMLKQLTSFSDDIQNRGQRPGGTVLEMRACLMDAETSKAFNIPVGEKMVFLKRLRLADHEPMAIETAYLPARYFADIELENLEGRSLYQLMREKYGISPTRAIQKITAAACPQAEAGILHIPRKSPALHIFRTTYDQTDRIVEIVESYYRGDKYIFQAELRVEN